MEVHQLIYFVTVAKYGHMTRAAHELHVSQSTLSTAVKKLETELGVRLCDRTARGVSLTPAGRIFLNQATRIVSELDYAAQTMSEVATQGGALRIRVACGETLGLPRLVYAAERGLLSDGGLCFTNIFEEYLAGDAMLLSRDADLLFTYSPINRPEIVRRSLYRDRFLALLRRDDPLAERKSLSMRELAKRQLVSPREHSFLRDCLDALFGGENLFTPPNIFICLSDSDIPALVSEGLGAAVIPGLCLKLLKNSEAMRGLVAIPIEGEAAFAELSAAQLTNMPMESLCTRLIDAVSVAISVL